MGNKQNYHEWLHELTTLGYNESIMIPATCNNQMEGYYNDGLTPISALSAYKHSLKPKLKDLKDFLNTLNEEQLKTIAYLHVADSTGYYVTDFGATEEDHYLTDEGWAPVSTFEADDEDDKLENYDIQKSGHPFIYIE